MAATPTNFFSVLFALPIENESYFLYILSLKFIWAPASYFGAFIKSSLWDRLWDGTREGSNHRDSLQTDTQLQSPLYTHPKLLKSPSLDQECDDALLMIKKAQDSLFIDGDDLGNTPLTHFLAERVFNNQEAYQNDHHPQIISVLTRLCELAKTSAVAHTLLTTANRPRTPITTNLRQSGYPLNTPLMLLVKAGDTEAVRLLLPFYGAVELMNTTPRGNSVFHIASITGQYKLLMALKVRAQELGVWREYKNQLNDAGYTAYKMLCALLPQNNLFRNLLDFSDPFLGGEEINKVAASDQGQIQVYMARKGAVHFHDKLIKEEEQDAHIDDSKNQESYRVG